MAHKNVAKKHVHAKRPTLSAVPKTPAQTIEERFAQLQKEKPVEAKMVAEMINRILKAEKSPDMRMTFVFMSAAEHDAFERVSNSIETLNMIYADDGAEDVPNPSSLLEL